MKVIVDRFEGGFAVVELPDRTCADMPRILIPGAKEGDVISIEIDEDTTKIRKTKIDKLMNEVWND